MIEIDPHLADTITHLLFVALALVAGAVIGFFMVED
jgi:uncharacterized protein YneF (UPF0154 family)